MALYVYCPRKSTGAFELAQALGANRLRRFDGQDFWNKNRRFTPEAESAIVCWGTHLPELDNLTVVNSMELTLNKYQQWQKISAARVPSPKMVKPDGWSDPKAYARAGYLGRSFQHTGGLDLLNPLNRPDYYVVKETFTNEYRIHSFNGKSIRAGQKVPREGLTPVETLKVWKPESNLLHPWIRSYDGGWRIKYDGFTSTASMRDLAHRAVKALGLTFGAVDIAQRTDGSLIVLEVNTAPGIEGGTLNSYVRAIQKFLKKETPEGV